MFVHMPAARRRFKYSSGGSTTTSSSFGKRGCCSSVTCQFQLDEDKGSRRDFLLACPIALAAATACSVLPDRWFTPHFWFLRSLHSLLGMLLLKGLGFILTFGLLAGLIAQIALGLLSRMRSKISGMFTFEKLALYLVRFESSFFICVTPLM